MDQPFEYIFPAIRGIQAQREFYVTQCPLPLIPKLFLFDEEELMPEFRAQRSLNRSRIPEMSEYMVSNPGDWIFSALTASIDSDVRFEAIEGDSSSRIGLLHVPMAARFIINDGQHRRAAIEQALIDEPGLADESVGLVFFIDRGLERSQQMFADLNRHAVKPSKSLGLLYDHRDPMAEVTRLAVFRSPFLRDVVELEKTTLAPRSRKLFTLSAIHNGTLALLGTRIEGDSEEGFVDALASEAEEFWSEMSQHFPEWLLVRDRKLTAAEVRRDFIHSHAIVLHALGCAGRDLISARPDRWRAELKRLDGIDWSRSNELWEGRAMTARRVSKSRQNVVLTTNAIKSALGLDLTPEEQRAEDVFLASKGARDE